MHLSSSRAFQRYQKHDLKRPNLVDFIFTKQNKLPCFGDRYDEGNLLVKVMGLVEVFGVDACY
jgi:hypothetical protein